MLRQHIFIVNNMQKSDLRSPSQSGNVLALLGKERARQPIEASHGHRRGRQWAGAIRQIVITYTRIVHAWVEATARSALHKGAKSRAAGAANSISALHSHQQISKSANQQSRHDVLHFIVWTLKRLSLESTSIQRTIVEEGVRAWNLDASLEWECSMPRSPVRPERCLRQRQSTQESV